jgi:hypothetical protein
MDLIVITSPMRIPCNDRSIEGSAFRDVDLSAITIENENDASF